MERVLATGRWLAVGSVSLLGWLPGLGQGAAPSQKPLRAAPLRVELTMPLDAGWAKAGTRIRARAVHEWAGPGCRLRVNDAIEGHVSQVVRHSKSATISTMRLVFDRADCDHHGLVGVGLAIVALIAPVGSETPIGQAGLGKAPAVLDLPMPIGGGGATPMRSAERGAAINRYAVTGDATVKEPEQMSLGQVVGIPGTKLQIVSGTDGGSIVSVLGKDARLEGHTTLILLAIKP